MDDPAAHLQQTALYELHQSLGARIVPFAGYHMPLNYPPGIIKEHRHTRTSASLFDVSHMGQIRIHGAGAIETLESLMPIDLSTMEPGQQRYNFLTNSNGGIVDDLMISRFDDYWQLIVNAANKMKDLELITTACGSRTTVDYQHDAALIALQGPAASTILSRHSPQTASLPFMHHGQFEINGIPCSVSRSGYTGEDGFEISVSNSHAIALAQNLLAHPEVEAAGLGCRDSLRLEAGLCLHGNDINEETSPLEANLLWAISPDRRVNGKRPGKFPGDARILKEMKSPPIQCRVGLRPEGKIAVRPPAALFTETGVESGLVTSGSFGPSVEGPIAMGYVKRDLSALGTRHHTKVRGNPIILTVVDLPFVAHNYHRRQ